VYVTVSSDGEGWGVFALVSQSLFSLSVELGKEDESSVGVGAFGAAIVADFHFYRLITELHHATSEILDKLDALRVGCASNFVLALLVRATAIVDLREVAVV